MLPCYPFVIVESSVRRAIDLFTALSRPLFVPQLSFSTLSRPIFFMAALPSPHHRPLLRWELKTSFHTSRAETRLKTPSPSKVASPPALCGSVKQLCETAVLNSCVKQLCNTAVSCNTAVLSQAPQLPTIHMRWNMVLYMDGRRMPIISKEPPSLHKMFHTHLLDHRSFLLSH